jgi:glycosyltransferase involved in cell wall biosynthesis
MKTTNVPLVSIIIPTFNQAIFLEECLLSVFAQTFQNFEVVIIDNYSFDDTHLILKKYRSSNVKVLKFRNNGVIAVSRNKGVEIASGEFVAFLDSDDVWHPKKLEYCMEELRAGSDICCHDLNCFGDRSGYLKAGPEKETTFGHMFRKGASIFTSATVLRKSILAEVGGFSENYAHVTSEDYHLWLKLAFGSYKFSFLNMPLGNYRIHSFNCSRRHIKHLKSVISVVDDFYQNKNLDFGISQKHLTRRKAFAYYSAGRELQKAGEFKTAMKILARALQLNPFFLRSYLSVILSYFRILR